MLLVCGGVDLLLKSSQLGRLAIDTCSAADIEYEPTAMLSPVHVSGDSWWNLQLTEAPKGKSVRDDLPIYIGAVHAGISNPL